MKKAIGMFAALMLALAMTGVAFAMWDKTLYIDGTVSTGEVDAEFTLAFSDDDGMVNDMSKDSLDDGKDPPTKDKDVAKTIVEIDSDPQRLIVTITNAYPSYEPTIWFDIKNTGSIPVKIQSITITEPAEVPVTITEIMNGQQIDADETVQGDIELHIEQIALESTTYTFTIEIYLVQWNEYAP